MPNVTPIQQPPIEDLRNALQIANAADGGFGAIARLIRHAIEGLSEPSLAAMQAGEILLREWSGTPEPERQLRDTVAGILHAQLSGIVPKTWEGV